MEYGILSLVPPFVAILLAIITKQTVVSLFIGVWVGSTIINDWNPLVAFVKTISDYVIPSIADPWNAGLLVLISLAGGFVHMIKASGAAYSIGEFAGKKISSRRNAQTIAWVGAFAFFYTEPCLLLGAVMRPITEKFNISKVKLAYIIDSMGCNVATMSPINSYAPFITGLIATQFTALGLSDNPWSAYIGMYPYNLYGVFAMITALFVIRTGLDFGPMYEAEMRAIKTGKLVGDKDNPMIPEEEAFNFEGKKVSIKNFVIPMITLFVTIFSVILWSGNVVENGFVGCFINANITLAMSIAYITASIAAGIVGVYSNLFNFKQAVDNWTQGVINMMTVNIIVVLAWSIGSITGIMDVGGYLVGLVNAFLSPTVVPALIFVIGALIAFATGSSWGVWSVMMPIAIPMAHALGLSIPLTLGAVISGGLFGDHCSPISDTTILSSTGAACDHIEHVRTQLPYAIVVAVAAFVGFLVGCFTGIPLLSIVATLLLIVLIYNVLHKRTKKIDDIHFEVN